MRPNRGALSDAGVRTYGGAVRTAATPPGRPAPRPAPCRPAPPATSTRPPPPEPRAARRQGGQRRQVGPDEEQRPVAERQRRLPLDPQPPPVRRRAGRRLGVGRARVAVQASGRVEPPHVLHVGTLGQQRLRQRRARATQPVAVRHRAVQRGERRAGPVPRRPPAREGDGQQLGDQLARAGPPQHHEVVGAGQQERLGELLPAGVRPDGDVGRDQGERTAERPAQARRRRRCRARGRRRGRPPAARGAGPGPRAGRRRARRAGRRRAGGEPARCCSGARTGNGAATGGSSTAVRRRQTVGEVVRTKARSAASTSGRTASASAVEVDRLAWRSCRSRTSQCRASRRAPRAALPLLTAWATPGRGRRVVGGGGGVEVGEPLTRLGPPRRHERRREGGGAVAEPGGQGGEDGGVDVGHGIGIGRRASGTGSSGSGTRAVGVGAAGGDAAAGRASSSSARTGLVR